MYKLTTIILLTTLLVTSCRTSKKIEIPQAKIDDICESMIFNISSVNNISSDYYTVDTIFIANDCLNIWVSYSGGCGDADFSLYYNDNIQESMPPKTSLRLQLADNDPCRAIVQQKLYYNLSFFDDYANKNGILLVLSGNDKSVLYKR
jgi:hypothetical protein